LVEDGLSVGDRVGESVAVRVWEKLGVRDLVTVGKLVTVGDRVCAATRPAAASRSRVRSRGAAEKGR
jgi:hypothetical protein